MHWKRMDMRTREGHPEPGELVALRLMTNKGNDPFYRHERYDIGKFALDARDAKSKKLWWYGTRGSEAPASMNKHSEIWWCPVAQFDGI